MVLLLAGFGAGGNLHPVGRRGAGRSRGAATGTPCAAVRGGSASGRGSGLGASCWPRRRSTPKARGTPRWCWARGPTTCSRGCRRKISARWSFSGKRGYQAAWSSVNMRLDLAGYDPGQVDIPPVPEGVAFRLLETGEEPALLAAVEDAQPAWLEFYQGAPPHFGGGGAGAVGGLCDGAPRGRPLFRGRGEARLLWSAWAW